ncbi:hypothetical protein AVEN_116265-1 [Araneus ventricosus]|uniref:Uncharacterized protein n=1 Tax=Araneus ventricosus TaxID=182803 RepID=A0A4Y2SNT6_ARAVE|nr:hypothetical protein AVEN_99883-1 [Araneus ventricosus]GBN89090.1 hypothetical protein AVEN_116265-1 [Araneus ventricosus]
MSLNPKNGEPEEPASSKTLPRLRRSGCAATSYFESPLSSIISRSSVLNRSAARATSSDQNAPAETDRYYGILDNLRERSSKGDGRKVSSVDIADVKTTTFDSPRQVTNPQRIDISPPVVRSKILSSTLPSSHKVPGDGPTTSPMSDSGYEEFKALHSKLMKPEGKNTRSLKNSRQLSSSLTTLSTDSSDKKSQPSKRYSAMLTYDGSKGTLSGGSSPSRSPVQSRWNRKQFSSPDPTLRASLAFDFSRADSEPEETELSKSLADRGRQGVFLQNYLQGCQKENKKNLVFDKEKPRFISGSYKTNDNAKQDSADVSKAILNSDATKSKNLYSSSPKEDSDGEIWWTRKSEKELQFRKPETQSSRHSFDNYRLGRLSPTISENKGDPAPGIDFIQEDESDRFRSRSFTEPSKNKSAYESQYKTDSSSNDFFAPTRTNQKEQITKQVGDLSSPELSRTDKKVSFVTVAPNSEKPEGKRENSLKRNEECSKPYQAPTLGQVTGLFRRSIDSSYNKPISESSEKEIKESLDHFSENASPTIQTDSKSPSSSEEKIFVVDDGNSTFGSSNSIWIESGLRAEDTPVKIYKGNDLSRFPVKTYENTDGNSGSSKDWQLVSSTGDNGEVGSPSRKTTEWEMCEATNENGDDLMDLKGMLNKFASKRNGSSTTVLRDRFSDESRFETFSSAECQQEKKSATFMYSKKENSSIPEFRSSQGDSELSSMENRMVAFKSSPNFRNSFDDDTDWKCTMEGDSIGKTFAREGDIRSSVFDNEVNKENRVYSEMNSQSAAFRTEKTQRSIILKQRSSTSTVTRRIRIGQRTVRKTSRYTR